MNLLATIISLFFASLLSATLFPFQSEAVLSGFLIAGQHNWLILVLVATAGNTLGAIINWFIGKYISTLEKYRWFPVSKKSMGRAERWYRRYGKWSLLLSWVPIVGDPITVAAGVFREPLPMFIVIVLAVKAARYFVVAAIILGII